MSTSTACQQCGVLVTAGSRFCANCGADVSSEQGNVSTRKFSATQAMHDQLLERVRHAAIGEYEIRTELGRGGMATVYLAHDIQLDRKVAIKVMLPALLEGEDMVERFRLEARTAAALSHPHIIPIYSVRATEGLVFFVMKFVEGRPLDAIIRELGKIPVEMVRSILPKVGEALGYAHRRGVVHRDIKPANLMIDVEGLPVVTDFGIAKVADAQGLTMTGAMIGTPTYMSPEQCSGGEVTGASDQYSLGIVAYQMLAGRVPFEGDTLVGLLYKHCHEAPPPLIEARPDCPPALAAAVMRMLEKDPAHRFPSMEAAVSAIGAVSLAFDDPIRTQLMGLARKGGNTELLKRISTPSSPIPRPSLMRAAESKSARRTAPSAVATGAPVTAAPASPSPVTTPLPGVDRRLSRTPIIAGAAAVLAIAALVLWRPWAGPTTEPAATGPTVTAPAATVAGVGDSAPAPSPSPATSSPSAGSPEPAAPTAAARVASIQDDGTRSALTVGERTTLRAVTRDASGRVLAGRTLRWSSSNTARATVSPEGVVTALEPGNVTITGRVDDAMREFRLFIEPSRVASAPPASTDPRATADSQRAAATPPVNTAPAEPVTQSPPPVTAPATPVRSEPAAPPAPTNSREEVDAVIQRYARALMTKQLSEVRAAYPGLTTEQEAQVQALREYRDLRVTLTVGTLNFAGNEATALVNGTYEFYSPENRRTERLPVQFNAVLDRGATQWQIRSIRSTR